MKPTIIFATGNQGKMHEIRQILEGFDAEVLSMKEAGIDMDIIEDGETFEANALIKARAVHSAAPEALVLADDSGIEIDYMDKQPGVYSARFMGEDTSYTIKNQAIIDKLLGVEGDERSARYACAIAAVFPGGTEKVTFATVEGMVAKEAAGCGGFGYDPIFYLPEYEKTMAEITEEEKNRISHRGKALVEMKEEILAWYKGNE